MRVLVAILFLLMPTILSADDRVQSLLEPVVRVRSKGLGGSGTIVYSKENSTFILTNYHVIRTALHYRKGVEKFRSHVDVDFKLYVHKGNSEIKFTKKAGIIAHSIHLDLALLLVIGNFQTDRVAKLYPETERLGLFQKVWIVGYPNGHVNFDEGVITGLNIRRTKYWFGKNARLVKTNAFTNYGYSGGAAWSKLKDEWYLVGVPQSMDISKIKTCNGKTHVHVPIHKMGYFVSIEDVRIFLADKNLCFIDTGEPVDLLKLDVLPPPPFDLPKIKEIWRF